jgi:hypothetical protein
MWNRSWNKTVFFTINHSVKLSCENSSPTIQSDLFVDISPALGWRSNRKSRAGPCGDQNLQSKVTLDTRAGSCILCLIAATPCGSPRGIPEILRPQPPCRRANTNAKKPSLAQTGRFLPWNSRQTEGFSPVDAKTGL